MWHLVKCTDGASWYYFAIDKLRNRCKLIGVDLSEEKEEYIIHAVNCGYKLVYWDFAAYAEWESPCDKFEEWAYQIIEIV